MGFVPAAEADSTALIRRVTFDLTGLPPTPEEVEAFTSDDKPGAFERLVDRLLASPKYGERWAQHWLDLAHYADSNGFELDAERPDAWRYRDWVVAALNEDMPYDRFVELQLAGDEIAPGDPTALIATGFGRCGPREVVSGNLDPAVVRQSELTEITATVGSVFLGLTIGCARCHDHKFDALPTTDYYRLQSFFAAAKLVDVPTASKAETEAFEAAKKAMAEQDGPLAKGDGRAGGPLPQGPRGEEEGDAHGRRAGRPGDPREGADADPEADGRGARIGAEDHMGGRGRGRGRQSRRPRHPRGPEAPDSRDRDHPPPPPLRGDGTGGPGSDGPRDLRPRAGRAQAEGPAGGPSSPRRAPRLAAEGRLSRRDHARQDHHGTPCGPGAVADAARSPLDGTGDRQPTLAASLRPGDRRHSQRLRRAGRIPFASRTARLAGLRAGLARLAAQGHPSADGHLGRLPAGEHPRDGRRAGRGRPRQYARLEDESPEARGREPPRRHADRLGRPEREDGGPGRPGPHREGGRGPDLHRGRGGRPLARDRRPGRAPPALALPLPEAERALSDVRRLRRPGHPDLLRPARRQHARLAGARPPEQRLRRRARPSPRRPALSRGGRLLRVPDRAGLSRGPGACPPAGRAGAGKGLPRRPGRPPPRPARTWRASPGRALVRPPGTDPAEAAALVDFALAMLNRNEFVYLP